MSSKFDTVLPASYAIEQLPPVRGTIVDGQKTSGYFAGWTLTEEEIRNKYDPEGQWSTPLTIVGIHVIERWCELGYDSKNDPFVKSPGTHVDNTTREVIFKFQGNWDKEQMEAFVARKDDVFDKMCEIFKFTTEEEKEKMKKKFKWIRIGPCNDVF